MEQREFNVIVKRVAGILKGIIFIVVLMLFITIYLGSALFPEAEIPTTQEPIAMKQTKTEPPSIVDGIHVQTGLKDGEGLELVVQNCTGCHSSKLIIQNRMDAAGWKSTIKWMQQTQNLWELGENEDVIVSYLAAMYAPQKKGRRAQLTEIEWYELD